MRIYRQRCGGTSQGRVGQSTMKRLGWTNLDGAERQTRWCEKEPGAGDGKAQCETHAGDLAE